MNFHIAPSEYRRLVEAYNEVAANGDGRFSTDVLDGLTSFKKRLAYCRKHLKRVGGGSSRMVFALPNGHVIKLAYNRKGIEQNRVECDDWYKNTLECFPKVYGTADDFTWCEVEAAKPCKESDFKRLMGMTLREMQDLMVKLARDRGTGRELPGWKMETDEKRLDELEQGIWDDGDGPGNPTMYALNDYIGNYGPDKAMVLDFLHPKNWGIVKRNGKEMMVVVDSGMNDSIWNEFYKRNNRS